VSQLPPRTQSFSGQTPVRLEGNPNGPLAGIGQWRGVSDFDHGHLCRVFGLDPVRFYFDLPSSIRGVGSLSSGYGGGQRAGRRRINGYVMMAGRDEPVGKLSVVFDAERFRDDDPTNTRDFLDLNHS
jgi:hypothetical protein